MAIHTTSSSVTFGAVVIGAVGSFSFSNEKAPIEITEIGSSVRSYIAGVQGATASIEIFYDQATTTQNALETYIASGTIASLIVQMASSQTYTASAILTRLEITGSAGDVIRATCDFQCTGAVTIG